jgi:hypothetical protein
MIAVLTDERPPNTQFGVDAPAVLDTQVAAARGSSRA